MQKSKLVTALGAVFMSAAVLASPSAVVPGENVQPVWEDAPLAFNGENTEEMNAAYKKFVYHKNGNHSGLTELAEGELGYITSNNLAGYAYADKFLANWSGPVVNNGKIWVDGNADEGMWVAEAIGADFAHTVTNNGAIFVDGKNHRLAASRIKGMSTQAGSAVNEGLIYVKGNGVAMIDNSNTGNVANKSIINNGDIVVEGGIGIYYRKEAMTAGVVNNGRIDVRGDNGIGVLIENEKQAAGQNKVFTNAGTITASGNSQAIVVKSSKTTLAFKGDSHVEGGVMVKNDTVLDFDGVKNETLDLQNMPISHRLALDAAPEDTGVKVGAVKLTRSEVYFDKKLDIKAVDLQESSKLTLGDAVIESMTGQDSSLHLTTSNVKVTSNTTTNLSVTTNGKTTDDLDGNADQLLKQLGYTSDNAAELGTLKMQAGTVVGEVTKTGAGPAVEKTNESNAAKLYRVSAMPAMMTRIQMNELRKRMGDIRASEGTTGVWARYNGGNMQGDYGLDADFNMIQVGADTILAAGLPRLGAAFSYTKTEAEDLYGSTKADTYTLAGYGVWTWDNGAFADVIARAAKADTDMTEADAKGSLDGWLFSLSGEFGQRATFADTFYVEPSAEFTYTWLEGDSFRMNDVTRTIGDTESLVGRFGVALGKSCPSGFGDFYVRAGLVHEFMGNTSITSSKVTQVNGTNQVVSRTINENGNDTWVEYAVGGNINFNKNTYLYVDLERTEGASLEEDWRANVGVRYSF